ncbi:MAG: HI1506-related protein [Desulfocapsaceae bacterium]|nr:HI1506-related protein [Desulfocapsaceae bacterium]
MITITSRQAGFRRCGIAHPVRPVDYPDDRFSAEELKVLQAEPMLNLSIGKEEEKKGSKQNAGSGKKEEKKGSEESEDEQ